LVCGFSGGFSLLYLCCFDYACGVGSHVDLGPFIAVVGWGHFALDYYFFFFATKNK
jgi:hypothetical protein